MRALLVVTLLALAACSSAPKRGSAPASSAPETSGGGLYAPHISDGGPPVPPDISAIPEPVPQAEPLSRYGNRSPYTVLGHRSEEHTSELQSLMRHSYTVFCFKKKKNN